MDEELRRVLDNLDKELARLAVVREQVDRVLGEPQPRTTTPPTYMSGRWWRRDGTAFGSVL